MTATLLSFCLKGVWRRGADHLALGNDLVAGSGSPRCCRPAWARSGVRTLCRPALIWGRAFSLVETAYRCVVWEAADG